MNSVRKSLDMDNTFSSPTSHLHSNLSKKNEEAMAAVDRGHLDEEKLTDDAQRAAQACLEFLLQARYRPQGDYEICDDSRLKEISGAFYTEFAPLVKVRT
jgi:hypothetical protein